MQLLSANPALRGWNRFWFEPADPIVLAVVRIATGIVLLYAYATCLPGTLDYLGPEGWIDQAAVAALQQPSQQGPGIYGPWMQSVWFYVQQPQTILWLQGYFVLAIVLFALGLFTRVTNLLVLVGHLSFVHRALPFAYGLDAVLSMLLLYLLIGPSGRRLSLDAWLERRWLKGSVSRERQLSWTANVSLRAIQLHLCLIYLSSGLGKLRGDRWWSGEAFWDVITLSQIRLVDLRWLAWLGDDALSLASSLATAFTIGFEVGFVFLIWNRKLRPYLFAAAVMLHGGIALVMGLIAFGAVMLVACLAFVPPDWIYTGLARLHRYFNTAATAKTSAAATA